MTLGKLLFNMRAQDVVDIRTESCSHVYTGEIQFMQNDTLSAFADREVAEFRPRQDIVVRHHKASNEPPVSQFRAGAYELKDVIMLIRMEIIVK